MKESLHLPSHPPYVHTVKIKLTALLVCVCVLIIGAFVYLPGVVSVSSSVNGRDLPIYCVQTDNPQIALTFDAAWGNEDTQQLIDILNQYQVKATFFVVGDWVDRYPESVKALSDAGMEVMNHSDDHAHFSQLSEQQIVDNVNACADKIEAVTGTRPTLFRCPYGEYDDHVVSTINGMGVQVIQWDVEALAADGTPCTARGWAYGV